MPVHPRWPHIVSFMIGLWLFLSPWILRFNGFNPAATSAWTVNPIATNMWIVGTMIVLLALLALIAHEKWEDWLAGALGAWLIISPWVTRVNAHADILLNSVISGTLLVALAVWSVWLGGSASEIDRLSGHR